MNEPMSVHVSNGQVDFPLWVKVLAWIVGLSFPVAIGAGMWVGAQIFEMSIRLTRMETKLELASNESYPAAVAAGQHSILKAQIDQNGRDIAELQRLHGRARSGGDQ